MRIAFLILALACAWGQASAVLRKASDVSGVQYVAGGGTAQAQTATLVPAIAAQADGQRVCWLPIAANTAAAPTLAVNGLVATNITKLGATALVANDLTTTAVACAILVGANYQLQNPQTSTSGAAGGGVISYSAPALTLTVGTRYAPPGGGGTPASVEAESQVASPSAATVTKFYVTASVAPGAGNSWAFTWQKAAVAQSLTCTIANTATSCSDTTNSFTVAQGDLTDVKIVSSGTPVATPMVSWLAQWGTTGSNGTVNSGTAGNLSKYTSTGTAVSEHATAAGMLTLLTTPSSANLAAALTDETGTGLAVFGTSPTLVTPALGTPSALVLTNATGLPIAGGGTGGTTAATARGALGVKNSYALQSGGGTSPLDSTTYYFSFSNQAFNVAENSITKTSIPMAGTVTALILEIQVNTTQGSTENVTVTLRINGVDTAITGTMAWDSALTAIKVGTFTGTVVVAAADIVSIKMVTPAWATNPTSVRAIAHLVILEDQ